MDSDIRSAKLAAMDDPSKMGELIRRLRRAYDLDALWDLHQQQPHCREVAEAIASVLRGQGHATGASVFDCKSACFPLLTYTNGSRLIELGEFEVDSDQTLASKLEVCGFVPQSQAKPGQDCYDSWITQERFPFQQKGNGKVRLALINTGKKMQYERDFATMAKRLGRQLCDHAHGLTVAQEYPDLQRKLCCFMFGARGLSRHGDPAVLVLFTSFNLRWLGYDDVDFGWDVDGWALVAG